MIDQASLCPEDAAEVHLRRGKAQLKLSKLSQSRDDLELARQTLQRSLDDLELAWQTLQRPRDAGALYMQVLGELEQWQKMLELADRCLQLAPGSPEFALGRARALRNLGMHDKALEELQALPFDPLDIERIRINSALLCDSGDFEGALELLKPATSPLESAPKSLLALRGWAHQNCESDEDAAQAESVYRQAMALDAEDHWSRKGLANALRRLGKVDEANLHYERVIEYARQQRDQHDLNPYDACLAGWCCYRLDRFKEAADFSSAGLAAFGVGVAAQFDYGLFLLADSSFDSAKDQFERSIVDMVGKNYLRRCGLLYVALTDLRDAMQRLPSLAGAPQTYSVQASLAKALEQTLAEFPDGKWARLKRKVQACIDITRREASSEEAHLVSTIVEDPPEHRLGRTAGDRLYQRRMGQTVRHPLANPQP